jgi:signal transduction histidine kinase/ligand-binding sensor domain-containing protein
MITKHAQLFLIVQICFCASMLSSQTIESKFESLSPIAAPFCLTQDSFGFIWIGSQEGLLKYDGHTYKRYTQIPFDTSSLSVSWITVIKEDSKGNLWVGTWGGGLNYFDQRTDKFTQCRYDIDKSYNFSNSNVSSILVNDDGSLWVGTQDLGLFYVWLDDKGIIRCKKYDLSSGNKTIAEAADNNILTVYKDRDERLWLGTRANGLACLDPLTGEIQKFRHEPDNPSSLSSNTVSAVCQDDSGNIWIGTGTWMTIKGNGLNRYCQAENKFVHFTHDPDEPGSISSNHITSLLIDQKGVLWIGTVTGHLNSIPLKNLSSKQKPKFRQYPELTGKISNSIYEDRSGNIWITFFSGSVYRYHQEQNPFTLYQPGEQITKNIVSFGAWLVYVDRAGKIWFGFGTEDLYYFNPVTGLTTRDQKIPVIPSGSQPNWITGMCEDEEGYFWIATIAMGLIRLNPANGNYTHYSPNPDNAFGLRSDHLGKVIFSQSGNIWISTQRSGLQLYDPEENTFYHFDLDTNTAEDDAIYSAFEDALGTLWIGTWKSGLYALRVKDHKLMHVEHFMHNPKDRTSISNNLISSIIRPQVIDTSALWLATANGLNRLDLQTGSSTHFFVEDGLPSNLTMNLLEDNKGNIWCACSKGIAVYNIKTVKIQSFGQDDGLPVTGFGGRFQNADKTSNGQLIFGSDIGAVGFYPENLKENPVIPPVYLTNFKLFHKSVKLDTTIQFKKTIQLRYDQNVFSFDFTALNFTNPGKNQYAYNLEGFHEDWINLGNERTARFTNLDPGEYIFRVKGANNHGIWNEAGASVRIIIIPPWWRTTWAYITYILIFGMVLIALFRFELRRRQRKTEQHLQREKELRSLEEAEHRAVVAELQNKAAEAQKEKEKEQMRSRIASDLHDEIGSNLSSIALISHMLEEKVKLQQTFKVRLQDIQRIARLTAESMRDIVWFINPENDDMDKLLKKMRETANLLLEQTNFEFNMPGSGITFQGDLNFRRNLYLIYKESLQNIIKHAGATKIEINFQQSDHHLHLLIRDNGKGFNTQLSNSGNGLKNIQRRAGEMGAVIDIRSGDQKGTEISLSAEIP